jgi:drug/metabolite transporter (DMT)-like permease
LLVQIATMNNNTKAHIAVAVTNLFYATNFLVMKNLVPDVVTPYTLNLFRVIGATALFWILYLIKPSKIHIEKKDWIHIIICTITGIIINQVLFVKGVALTTPFRASLLMLFTPIAVVFFALFFQKKPITNNKIIGLLLGVIGAAILVVLKEKTKNGENHLLGDAFIVMNAVSYAFYLVWVKRLTQKYDDIHIVRIIFTLATLLMLPFGISDLAQVDIAAFSMLQIISILFIIIAVTFLAYLFNMYSINILGSTTTGAYIYTQPFFASALFIYISGNTQFLFIKIIAALFIFIGLYFVSFKKEINSKPNF